LLSGRHAHVHRGPCHRKAQHRHLFSRDPQLRSTKPARRPKRILPVSFGHRLQTLAGSGPARIEFPPPGQHTADEKVAARELAEEAMWLTCSMRHSPGRIDRCAGRSRAVRRCAAGPRSSQTATSAAVDGAPSTTTKRARTSGPPILRKNTSPVLPVTYRLSHKNRPRTVAQIGTCGAFTYEGRRSGCHPRNEPWDARSRSPPRKGE
jgi:hypothetical protein